MKQGISLQTIVEHLYKSKIGYGAVTLAYDNEVLIETHLDQKYFDLWNKTNLIFMDGESADITKIEDDKYEVKTDDGYTFYLSEIEYSHGIFNFS